METEKETTISVKKSTLERIKGHCKRSENYDTFINHLLDLHEKETKA